MIKLDVPKVDIEFYFEDKQYNLYKRADIIVLKESSIDGVYYFYYQNDKTYIYKNFVNNKNALSDNEKKNYLKRLYKAINACALVQNVIDKKDIKKLIK